MSIDDDDGYHYYLENAAAATKTFKFWNKKKIHVVQFFIWNPMSDPRALTPPSTPGSGTRRSEPTHKSPCLIHTERYETDITEKLQCII